MNEFVKLVQGVTDVSQLKNINCDLAVCSYYVTEPPPLARITSGYDEILGSNRIAIPEGYTLYDKLMI